MVETVRQRLSGDAHRDLLDLGEVRQALPARLLHLAEHDLLGRSVQRFPRLHPALEGAFLPVAELPPVAILQVLEQSRGLQRRLLLQSRDDLAVPDLREWIIACTPVPLLSLQNAAPPILDSPGAALRDARLGTRPGLRLPSFSAAHV
jgi:hypothetical protein